MSFTAVDYRPWIPLTPWIPPYEQIYAQLSRREARGAYNEFMQIKDSRVSELQRLGASNGLVLEFSIESVSQLAVWVCDNVQRKSRYDGLIDPWDSISNDIGIYLSELILCLKPSLYWKLDTGTKAGVSYQQPVITGFTNVPNKAHRVCPLNGVRSLNLSEGEHHERRLIGSYLAMVEGIARGT